MPRLTKGQPAGIWSPSTPRFLSGQASLATPFSTAEVAEVSQRRTENRERRTDDALLSSVLCLHIFLCVPSVLRG
jgi:hypothetical protein